MIETEIKLTHFGGHRPRRVQRKRAINGRDWFGTGGIVGKAPDHSLNCFLPDYSIAVGKLIVEKRPTLPKQ